MIEPDPLTPDRFAALADAYGGDLARWPERHRAAAAALARDPALGAVLARAAALDAALDAWRVAAPAPALAQRIVGRAAIRPRALFTTARLWWSAVGLGITLAGAAAGSVAAAALPAEHGAGTLDEATAFGDLAGKDL